MLTAFEYEKLNKETWQSDRLLECCFDENPDDTTSGECCYDTWYTELLQVNTTHSEAEESAKQLLYEYNIIAQRRDKLKFWYDELTKLDDISRRICDQLEVISNQVGKIHTNTEWAVKAIYILYCMFRDFYVQVDWIKSRYDQVMNCIKCIDNPALAPGQGIMKCLDDYYKKLDVIIKTRDMMLVGILSAIKIANQINQHIGSDFGLKSMITSWNFTFNCDETCGDTSQQMQQQDGNGGKGNPNSKCEGESDCLLEPMLTFPICNNQYYHDLGQRYQDDDNLAKDLARELLDKNKRKEELLACKQSLVTAIKEVDPKLRCK